MTCMSLSRAFISSTLAHWRRVHSVFHLFHLLEQEQKHTFLFLYPNNIFYLWKYIQKWAIFGGTYWGYVCIEKIALQVRVYSEICLLTLDGLDLESIHLLGWCLFPIIGEAQQDAGVGFGAHHKRDLCNPFQYMTWEQPRVPAASKRIRLNMFRHCKPGILLCVELGTLRIQPVFSFHIGTEQMQYCYNSAKFVSQSPLLVATNSSFWMSSRPSWYLFGGFAEATYRQECYFQKICCSSLARSIALDPS